MSTPLHAARRRSRTGRTHLALVRSTDSAAATQEGGAALDEPAEEQTRGPLPYRSATVRALMALGAMVTALLFPELNEQRIGFQRHPLKPGRPDAEALPNINDTPVGAPATSAPSARRIPEDRAPVRTVSPAADERRGKTAGDWVPARRTVAIAYTLPGPTPTGRHRGNPHVGQAHHPQYKSTGRHRRPGSGHDELLLTPLRALAASVDVARPERRLISAATGS